jgi:hypothetical protein
MKRTFFAILLVLFGLGLSRAQIPDSCKVSLSFENATIQQVLESLADKYTLTFSYQSNLRDLQKQVCINAINQPLQKVLTNLFLQTYLSFTFFAGQIIIMPDHNAHQQKILIEGKLVKSGTKEPVSFAGMEIKNIHKGTISDLQGYFRMEIESNHLTDTLLISSLNYYPLKIPIKHLTLPGMHTFYMTEKVNELPSFEIQGEKFKFDQWGNHKWIPSGSFYLDTHGQQTALFIKNESKDSGKIVSASFYLSGKGNTDAPFRVHIYSNDTTTGKPGQDLIPEMIIIRPDHGKGWFEVNLARYKIPIPETGFFVAIEGIFPGDYNFFFSDESQSLTDEREEESDDFNGETISYGQQIGYSGGSENHTWHYSIDQTWFQLKKRHFNALISAKIKLQKTRNKHGLFGLFGRKNKNNQNITTN